MAGSLEEVGGQPGGDAIARFLRVGHNDDGTSLLPVPVYLPSGDTTGAHDAGMINQYIQQDGGVQLGMVRSGGTPYWVNAPLTLAEDGMAFLGPSSGNPIGNANPPFTSSPARAGTVIRATATFSGSGMIVAQYPGATRCLQGVTVAGIGLDGNLLPAGTTHGVVWGCDRSYLGSMFSARVTGNGYHVVGAGAATGFLVDFDSRMPWLLAYTCAGDGIYFNAADTSDTQIPFFKAVGCGGYGINNLSPGQQFTDFHIYQHTGPAAVNSVTRSTTLRGRLTDIDKHGVLLVDDAAHSGGFTVDLTNVRDCGKLTDNTYDVVNYAPGSDVRGGKISMSVLTTQANRPRYGANLVNAHCVSTVIGTIAESYISPAASCFGTGPTNTASSTTPRNFNALA